MSTSLDNPTPDAASSPADRATGTPASTPGATADATPDPDAEAESAPRPRVPGLRGLRHHSVRWNLRAATLDGAAYALMVGLGQEILSAFILALFPGAAVAAGLVLSVPLLIGATMQTLSPWIVRRIGSLRTAVIVYTLLQAASLLALGACGILRSVPMWVVFVLVGLYWGSGLAGGAAWSTWMPGNVPVRLRPRYFGRRTRIIHGCTVVGLLLSGVALQQAKETDYLVHTFAVLFFTAAVARCISAVYQTFQAEGTPLPPNHRSITPREILRLHGTHPGLRLMRYMLVVQFTVWIAHGFLTPFALDLLKFNYVQNQLLIAAPYITRMLILPFVGAYAHNHGARKVLFLAGLGIVPLSAAWTLSDSFFYLFAVQLVAGIVWASYELSTFLNILETIPENERTSIMTSYYLGNSCAMVAGSLIGGAILSAYAKSHEGYMFVFLLSLIARAVSVLFLYRLTPRTPR